jgi:hypothetical protein
MSDKGQAQNTKTPRCESDPIGSLKEMFVDITMGSRLARGQAPAKRPVFLKPHGIARGSFQVNPNLTPELRLGIFGEPNTFPAWIRFSSDTVPSRPDLKTTVGIGIKMFGVSGPKLFGNPADTTHDFILQNHDVFFVDSAADMCAFTKAAIDGEDEVYLKEHPITAAVLQDMEKLVPSVLGICYWSVLPHRFGPEHFVKYKLEPETYIASGERMNIGDPNYLAVDMRNRLLVGEFRFRFMVQFQIDNVSMPLDQATVRWSEQKSVPVQVATLVLPVQDILTRGQGDYGENLAMNPWRVLAEHEPVGSIAAARKVIYGSSSELRRNVNGVPDGEPINPRPLEHYPAARDSEIVRAKIHPAIGIARVGNATNDYFVGPEVVDPPPASCGNRRDNTGALKRQAARFRLYGYNRSGEVVSELTADSAAIEWQVHLANLKASWYQFQIALDIPEATSAAPSLKRNKDSLDRSKLAIISEKRAISGRDGPTESAIVFEGEFCGQPVYLGELKTDSDGRLIVLGGRGKTGCVPGAKITTFANNDGWHDDVSDGPVTANVSIGGRVIPVDPAWVVVAPPNYAPDLKGVRTLYDLMVDVFIDAGWLAPPGKVSFARDVLPIFQRLAGLQWVNAGYASAFGYGGSIDMLAPRMVAKLADPSDGNRSFRSQVANSFRDYNKDSWSPEPWPWLYGDAMDIPFATTPRQNTMLARNQILCLKRWAEGDFVSDFQVAVKPFHGLDEVPVTEQPTMLDRANLDFCLADAFHPGCELTWPMRHASMYMAPFRIRHRGEDEKPYVLGDVLTPAEALSFDGPLYGQRPGWLTRWMAVPWHTDTASCRSQADYDRSYDPFVPTFWPARVPNQVMSEAAYKVVTDPSRSSADRLDAFKRREGWIEQILDGSDYLLQIREMLDRYGEMGLLEARKGLDGDPDVPEVVYVSDARKPTAAARIALSIREGETTRSGVVLDFVEHLGNFPHKPPHR